MDLEGKVAVVTGATSGIGKATAELFVREGARVAAVGRSREALDSLVAGAPEGSMGAFQADLCDDEQRARLAQQVGAAMGEVDILVNAAGIIASGSIETTGTADWHKMMNINIHSVFELTRAFLPSIKARRGTIINVSSVAGVRSFPNLLAYSVSKAALDQFTRCTALELAASGVRVNAINPGVVVTQLHRRGGMNEEQYQAFLERSRTTHPMGRAGVTAEIAELILFLASDKSGWITGVTLPVDGGRHLTCAR